VGKDLNNRDTLAFFVDILTSSKGEGNQSSCLFGTTNPRTGKEQSKKS